MRRLTIGVERTTLNTVHQISEQTFTGVRQLQERDRVEEHKYLLQWLNPNSINAEENLNEALKRHHPGTGQWLFDSQSFKQWSTGQSSMLWMHGIRK